MSRIVKFTHYMQRYTVDLYEALHDPTHPEYGQAVQLVELLKKRNRARSQKRIAVLESQIFDMLNMSLDVELEVMGISESEKLFSIETFDFALNNENSSLGIYYRDNSLMISGDIWFELEAKRDITYAVMEKWEEKGGQFMCSLSCAIGEYAIDSGSESWEIEED